METIVKKVSLFPVIQDEYREAADILRSGGLVAFPTETVYGLGGDGLLKEAAGKIYSAKGRPSDNPLIVHIAEIESLEVLSDNIPKAAYVLAEKFWPGPLTIILPKSKRVPPETTGGLDTVAVRMPNHPVALALIKEAGICIAAPSANASGRPSPTNAEHVREDLYGKIDMILDGGETDLGIESTIVDLTGDIPTILRPGCISEGMIEAVIGKAKLDAAILEENKEAGFKPKAPGMKYRHYAPKGELTLYRGDEGRIAVSINAAAKKEAALGKTVGIIASEETKHLYAPDPSIIIKVIGSKQDGLSVARGLYRILRELDSEDVNVILGECFEGGRYGQAIMNRMLKAAGYRVVEVG